MKAISYFLLALLLCACQESNKQRAERLLNEWSGRELAFPAKILCIAGEDTVSYKIPYADFLVVTYADSLECVSFRKHINGWKKLIAKADSLTKGRVAFMFFLQPDDVGEMRYLLHKEKFTHPICYDLEGKLYSLNKFPAETGFRSFLLDVNRQILTVGNPAHDPEVEKAYDKIILDGGILKESQ